jgi:hypothetical protein
VGLAEVLVGSRQPHIWLVCIPTQPLADQEVRFRVGWFDPAGLALDGTPEVTVRRGNQELARLSLHPSQEGWTSEPWRPPEPGAYAASSSLTALGLEPLTVSRMIDVLPASDTSPASTLYCAAHLAPHGDRAAVEAELKGRCREPLLVLAADGDPQAARTIRALESRATVLLPLDAEPASEMSVAILGEGAAGLEVLRHVPVVRPRHRIIDLALATPQREVWPGTEVAVRATCRQAAGLPAGTTLVARLIDAADTGYVQGASGPQGWRSAEDALRLTIVSSDAGPLTMDSAGRETAESTPAAGDITTVLSEGVTLWSTCLATEGEGTELRVPIPAQPGLYKLVVVARTPAGETASAATVLDARRGVRLEVDGPPRLTVGDRSVVTVLVENASPQPVEVRVQYDAGAGLHLETLRVADTRTLAAPLKTGEPVMLHLPAAGRAWLHLSVEATQAGAERAWAAVSAGAWRQTASCAYEVRPLDAVTSDTVLRIQRTLLVWTPPPDVAGVGSSPKEEEPRWNSAPFSPETRLMPGQFLEVAEELTLREPAPEVDWRQRVPPTCHSAAGQLPQIQSLGPRQPDQPGTLVFKVPALRPGTYTHRYFLAVVRPGVATIPTPELRRGDATVPVVVEPADLQIVVPETE